jgi:aminobenzoyl-glutamate transport protein
VDPLLAGLTQEAARLYDSKYMVPATANYYFMIGSTFLLTLIGAAVNNWIVEPRLGAYHAPRKPESSLLLPEERRGLMAAGVTLLFEIILLLFLTLPDNALLRDAKGNLDPFFQGMVVLMSLGFLLPAITYGMAAGTIKNNQDVGRMIEETFGTMGSYIALAFAASQFVAYFGWSNLGLIFAVTADLLRISLPNSVIVCLSLFAPMTYLSRRLGEMGAVGPVFVLCDHGLPPELTQAGYPSAILVTSSAAHALYATDARSVIRACSAWNVADLMLPYSKRGTIGWTVLLYSP